MGLNHILPRESHHPLEVLQVSVMILKGYVVDFL